jgi:diphosphomevalonate decarboxylase
MTNSNQATAVSFPNIAFIKYWGNIDHDLNIPTNGSISMNLSGLETRTTVTFNPALKADKLILNGEKITGEGLDRVSRFLDRVRKMANLNGYAQVTSENNFPTGSGIASSASAFAALSLAATAASELSLDTEELSRLARTGSGSASRSVPEGYVEWQAGEDHQSSYAYTIAPPDHWDLIDLIAIVSQEHKVTGSTGGHAIAHTSPLQNARLVDVDQRLDTCRQAILDRDFATFAKVVELDSNLMHAVMMTSSPPLIYWLPGTLAVMQAVQDWRRQGMEVCYTIDAGPNIHVICTKGISDQINQGLTEIQGVQKVLTAQPGGPTKLE